MSIHAALHHRTRYRYDRRIHLGPQTVRLRPAPHCRTKILSYSLEVSPSEHFINWQQDSHANYLARLVFPKETDILEVSVDLVAEMAVHNPFDFFLEPYAEEFPFAYEPWLRKDLAPFLAPLLAGARLREMIAEWSGRRKMRTIDFLVAVNLQLNQQIRYLIRLEPGVQPPEQTLALASGSCRDSGWLLVNLLRGLGFAARFVSGYLIQLKPDMKSLDGPSGTDVDFTDLHAWCEVYLPGAGWIGLDPTSGLLAGEGHIPLACTPEPMTAAPLSGSLDRCEAELHHEMSVSRIYESPRVTKPYSDTQWAQILASGRAVDSRMAATDVRLTMGGEPTFVSIDDPDGEEWNFTANGVRKRELAGHLLKRLRSRYAPGTGFLHYGQGKWYPGETLPRWSLGCWWRKDGVPFWKSDALIADETRDYGHGEAQAKTLADHLIRHLGISGDWLMPAHEDIYYYMWRERRLPVNVDPLKNNLDDKDERDRIRRIFEQGLGKCVGYVLPVQRAVVDGKRKWTSGPWFLRRETLYLTPGDSPMGLRLPLDSLPWVAEADYPWLHHPDPLAELPPLPPRRERQMSVPGKAATASAAASLPAETRQKASTAPHVTTAPQDGKSAPWVVRTAVCIEPRHGRLHIFMPPVETAEDYIDLVAAVEDAVSDLGLPVIIEGEPPPFDPRLRVLKVTPDPGVIEVNMHPSASWDELVEKTETLYEEARLARLTAEKFMIDGRHTGTGGGNHIIIGGDTPADSPVLRRPDLLRSMLTYWNNHPSLSYIFSGLFIGPTSQAPRADEARNDSLYELGIAFKQVPPPGSPVQPWIVDRLFRNLLIDSAGNTHRAEFCIDKLYAPDSKAGRLGLVELRSYEMPPHERMSIAQHLLLRSLIAHFWETPYERPLVRWGTDIHDRWMLPHFVDEDLADVIAELKRHGFDIEKDWFAPHHEFRFPRIGEFTQRGVSVELRSALEPWHVLGEEGASGGTVRYVDSSVERMQVRVRGMTDPRHIITVNGRRLPLHPTGACGEFVCGVRYRAWQPPNCLQPLIAPHGPLTFDLVDTWNQRSLGGCRYHVAHPGGRSYETFPVNAYEAESRRLSRFEGIGHTRGTMEPPEPQRSREFPFTLDLRS